MKIKISTVLVAILLCSSLSSCYVYTTVVGSGAKGNQEITKWNHYVIYGLAPVGVSNNGYKALLLINYFLKDKSNAS
jgi:hypothetical protein